ncbi:hypothetical protein ES703_45980 [subsurface metagenome]
MSETYTTGGNALQKILFGNETAQSFSPVEDHILDYIDIDVSLNDERGIPVPHLYNSDITHEPVGGTASHAVSQTYAKPFKPGLQRLRSKMQPYSVKAGQIYCIKIYGLGTLPEHTFFWEYDKDAATYPRGHRIWRDNDTLPFIHYHDQDYIFCEFGRPPLPKPDPPPPIDHFATTDLLYIPFETHVRLKLATSVPCHLTCYYTDKKPLKHPTERVIRGATLLDGTYFCFVAWKSVEQLEPGDTLYHTFEVPDWVYCQVRWFTFRGTVDEVDSPSIGPIFSYHHPGALTTVNLGVSNKAYYRYAMSARPGDPDVLYNLTHDQEQALSYHEAVITYGQQVKVNGTYAYVQIRRTAILFNTGALPPCTLLQAVLCLDMRKTRPPSGYAPDWDWYLKVRAGQDLNAQITHLDLKNYSKILALGTQIGSKYADDLPPYGTQDLWYIDVPLEFINLDGFTVITSLTSKDETKTRPDDNFAELALFIKDSFSYLHVAYYKH